jgi:hypothetical protein
MSLSLLFVTLLTVRASAITLAPCDGDDVPPESRVAQDFRLPAGWRLTDQDQIAIYTADERTLHVGVYDKTRRLQAVYQRFGWLDADRGPRMRMLRYTVDCEWLPPEMTCDAWQQQARFALAYVLAWLNVDRPDRFPRIRLQPVPRPEYLRDPRYVLELRFQDFDDPRPSLHKVRYPTNGKRQILGLGGKYTVDMNVRGKWYWRDLEKDMSVLRNLTDARFKQVYDRSRALLLSPRWKECQSSFMLVLVHEVFHSFQIGHNNVMSTSLMYHSSLGALRTPPGVPEYGGVVIESTDILHLRNRWSRNNTRTPLAMSADFLAEFAKAMETDALPPRKPLRPWRQIRTHLLAIDPHDRAIALSMLTRLEKQLRFSREDDHRKQLARKLYERQQVQEDDAEWLNRLLREERLTGLLNSLADYV